MALRGSTLALWALCALLAAYSSSWHIQLAQGTIINVHNQCGSTVCAKYWVPSVGGSCSQQGPGGTWTVSASQSWQAATMWAITNTGCSGQPCNTGPPSGVTQFEISVNSFAGQDFYDISALAGFNVAMKVVPSSGVGGNCQTVDCRGNSASLCPNGFYTGGPDASRSCPTGTNYDIYLCA